MQSATKAIIRAALKQDGSFTPEQIGGILTRLEHKVHTGNDPPVLLLTQKQTARLLSCSRWSVRRMSDSGLLRPIRLRGLIRYKRADIEQLLESGNDLGEKGLDKS